MLRKSLKQNNNIAIISPSHRFLGDSLKRRILDNYSRVLNRIDVLSISDLYTKNADDYLCYLYFEDDDMLKDIDRNKLKKVSYFFDDEDYRMVYESVHNHSREFKNAFGEFHKEDSITYPSLDSKNEVIDIIKSFTDDEKLIEQIETLDIVSKFVINDNLSIVLFTKEEDKCFTKFVTLDKPFKSPFIYFSRILVYAIKLDGDMLKEKTTESFTRNLAIELFAEKHFFNRNPLDFYTYYSTYKWIKAKSKYDK